MRLLVIRDKTFAVQEQHKSDTLIEIRIDPSLGSTTRASLIKIYDAWAFTIEENQGYWSYGSNIGISAAMTPEDGLNDLFCHIRMCNYAR